MWNCPKQTYFFVTQFWQMFLPSLQNQIKQNYTAHALAPQEQF